MNELNFSPYFTHSSTASASVIGNRKGSEEEEWMNRMQL